MFSLLLKLTLLLKLNILSVPLTAFRAHLKLPLLPEVHHVLAALVFVELKDITLGLEALQSIAHWTPLWPLD